MTAVPNWTIRAEPIGNPEITEVMREYIHELGRRVLGRDATATELSQALDSDSHRGLAPPHGEFLVARSHSGEFLGCVGVRLLPEATAAEIKRMFVHPAGRGAGLGRGLLLAAEQSARSLGATRAICETNTALAEARGLYVKNGYVETEPYEGDGKAEHWYAKDLD